MKHVMHWHKAALLAAALLLLAPVSGNGQVLQDSGEQQTPGQKPAGKANSPAQTKVQEPAVGGRVLSECSAVEATERLSSALSGVKEVKDLRTFPGQAVQLSYRGRQVNLDVTAHGSCKASFQASLPYRGRRPGEAASIRRAYKAIMEPAVAVLADCDPKACLATEKEQQAERREQAARQQATASGNQAQKAATKAGASVASAQEQAHSAATLAYLKAFSTEDAYSETLEIVRNLLPTPLTAKFPQAESNGVTVTLLENAPTELAGGSEIEALRTKVGNNALPEDLQERFRSVLAEVEEQISGPCYFVAGYVDFQNRCGALVRGKYKAYLSRREGSNWFSIGEPSIDFPDCPGR